MTKFTHLSPTCFVLVLVLAHLSLQSQDGSLKFSSAVLPEPLQTVDRETKTASSENFRNFYSKSKNNDFDESLIEQLKKAQQLIDEENENNFDNAIGFDEDDMSEEDKDDSTVYSSLADFGGGVSGGRQFADGERFNCYSCDLPDCRYGGVSTDCLQCFTSHVRNVNGEIEKTKGCISNPDHFPIICLTEKHDGRYTHAKNGISSQYAVDCCHGHMCNNNTEWPVLPSVPRHVEKEVVEVGREQQEHVTRLVLAVVCPVLVLGLAVLCILLLMRSRHRKRMAELSSEQREYEEDLVGLRAQAAGDSTLREIFDHSITSGSGSGLPFLVQRTLAKQIALRECIGKGRYGEVWRGIWNGESIAVKIFFSRDEASWIRETEIYSTTLLRHENILGYIGSDCTSRNSCTQLWLVTHYHPLGSLYDHLNRVALTKTETMRVLITTITGLVHLHTEIFGTQGKPAIAHRDIKSKNILVSMNMASFESFRRVDVYSFSLMMWETLRRCMTHEGVEDFALPFHDMVLPDPGFEDMHKVVCVDAYRPQIPARWSSDKVLSGLVKVMSECWHEDASVRLPALRIKKSLLKIAAEDSKLGMSLED